MRTPLAHFSPTLVSLFAATVLTACGADSSPTRTTQPATPHTGSAVRQRLPHEASAAALAAVFAANDRGIASARALVPPGAPLAPFIEAGAHPSGKDVSGQTFVGLGALVALALLARRVSAPRPVAAPA